MASDGHLLDEETLCDLGRSQTALQQLEYLALASGEPDGCAIRTAAPLAMFSDRGHEHCQQGSGKGYLPSEGATDRVRELFGVRVLGDVPGRAGAEAVEEAQVLAGRREHEDGRIWKIPGKSLDRRDRVAGRGEVDQADVRTLAPGDLNRSLDVGDVCADLEAVLFQRSPDAQARQGLRICDEYPGETRPCPQTPCADPWLNGRRFRGALADTVPIQGRRGVGDALPTRAGCHSMFLLAHNSSRWKVLIAASLRRTKTSALWRSMKRKRRCYRRLIVGLSLAHRLVRAGDPRHPAKSRSASSVPHHSQISVASSAREIAPGPSGMGLCIGDRARALRVGLAHRFGPATWLLEACTARARRTCRNKYLARANTPAAGLCGLVCAALTGSGDSTKHEPIRLHDLRGSPASASVLRGVIRKPRGRSGQAKPGLHNTDPPSFTGLRGTLTSGSLLPGLIQNPAWVARACACIRRARSAAGGTL
jgi:hypothetical protein